MGMERRFATARRTIGPSSFGGWALALWWVAIAAPQRRWVGKPTLRILGMSMRLLPFVAEVALATPLRKKGPEDEPWGLFCC